MIFRFSGMKNCKIFQIISYTMLKYFPVDLCYEWMWYINTAFLAHEDNICYQDNIC